MAGIVCPVECPFVTGIVPATFYSFVCNQMSAFDHAHAFDFADSNRLTHRIPSSLDSLSNVCMISNWCKIMNIHDSPWLLAIPDNIHARQVQIENTNVIEMIFFFSLRFRDK